MNDSYGGLSKCKSVKAAFCVDSFSACRLFSQSIRASWAQKDAVGTRLSMNLHDSLLYFQVR